MLNEKQFSTPTLQRARCHDVTVPNLIRLVQRQSFQPLRSQTAAGDGGAAAEGLEACVDGSRFSPFPLIFRLPPPLRICSFMTTPQFYSEFYSEFDSEFDSI